MLKIFPGKGTQQGSLGAGGGGFQRDFVAPTPASDFPTHAHPTPRVRRPGGSIPGTGGLR